MVRKTQCSIIYRCRKPWAQKTRWESMGWDDKWQNRSNKHKPSHQQSSHQQSLTIQWWYQSESPSMTSLINEKGSMMSRQRTPPSPSTRRCAVQDAVGVGYQVKLFEAQQTLWDLQRAKLIRPIIGNFSDGLHLNAVQDGMNISRKNITSPSNC